MSLALRKAPVWVPSPERGTLTDGTGADGGGEGQRSQRAAGRGLPNFTGACSVSPLESVTGNVTGTGVLPPVTDSVTWPTVNGSVEVPELADTPDTVTFVAAVTETSLVAVVLTGICPNVAGAGLPSGAAAAVLTPNPSMCPSLVPT